MSSRSHFISSHRNLVPSHPIPRKSGPVRSHLTKILVPSHPIPQRSHPIPVSRRDGTGPGRDILVLAVSLCFICLVGAVTPTGHINSLLIYLLIHHLGIALSTRHVIRLRHINKHIDKLVDTSSECCS